MAKNPLHVSKIPWLFPDLEKISFFPDTWQPWSAERWRRIENEPHDWNYFKYNILVDMSFPRNSTDAKLK